MGDRSFCFLDVMSSALTQSGFCPLPKPRSGISSMWKEAGKGLEKTKNKKDVRQQVGVFFQAQRGDSKEGYLLVIMKALCFDMFNRGCGILCSRLALLSYASPVGLVHGSRASDERLRAHRHPHTHTHTHTHRRQQRPFSIERGQIILKVKVQSLS